MEALISLIWFIIFIGIGVFRIIRKFQHHAEDSQDNTKREPQTQRNKPLFPWDEWEEDEAFEPQEVFQEKKHESIPAEKNRPVRTFNTEPVFTPSPYDEINRKFAEAALLKTALKTESALKSTIREKKTEIRPTRQVFFTNKTEKEAKHQRFEDLLQRYTTRQLLVVLPAILEPYKDPLDRH